MASDICLYTLVVGDHPYYPCSVRNHGDYAQKIGADHIVQRELIVSKRDGFHPYSGFVQSVFYEKMFRLKELTQKYKRVLFVDADMFIRPDSPSIFEEYPDEDSNQLWGVSESWPLIVVLGRLTNAMMTGDTFDGKVQKVRVGEIDFPIYLNAGMILMGQNHPLVNLLDEKEAQDVAKRTYFLDQDYPSYLISKYKLDFNLASGQWNFFYRKRGPFPHAINKDYTWPFFVTKDNKFHQMNKEKASFIHCFCWREYPYLWNHYYSDKISKSTYLRYKLKKSFLRLF